MTDRDSPVTEDELHAYVDGELAGRPPRRRRSVARQPSRRCRARRRLAGAGRCHPRTLWRDRSRARCRRASTLDKLARSAPLLARDRSGGGDRGVRGRRRRRLDGARRLGGGAEPLRHLHDEALDAHKLYVVEVRHPVEVPAPSEHASGAVALEAARLPAARARPRSERAKARRRPAAAGTVRPRRHSACTKGPSGERFTIYLRAPTRRRPRCAIATASASRRSTGSRTGSPMW